MAAREIVLVYDKQCPVCDAFCRTVQIPESVGELHRIDARQETAIMRDITRLGLDIDQGMVVRVDGVVHYGADAAHALAGLSRPASAFGRINQWLFASRRRSELLYPMFRSMRNVLLKALRKTKVNNLKRLGHHRF